MKRYWVNRKEKQSILKMYAKKLGLNDRGCYLAIGLAILIFFLLVIIIAMAFSWPGTIFTLYFWGPDVCLIVEIWKTVVGRPILRKGLLYLVVKMKIKRMPCSIGNDSGWVKVSVVGQTATSHNVSDASVIHSGRLSSDHEYPAWEQMKLRFYGLAHLSAYGRK